MRVLLEVSSGPDAGRKIRLGVGQELRIGRTEWADFCVPSDGKMSGVHFSLEVGKVTCRVQDLNSSNGTFVNGQRVDAPAELSDGAEILAGETQFVVRVEAEPKQQGPPPPEGILGAGVGVAAIDPLLADLGPSNIQLDALGPSNIQPEDPGPSNIQLDALGPSNIQPEDPGPSNIQLDALGPSNIQPEDPGPSSIQPSPPPPEAAAPAAEVLSPAAAPLKAGGQPTYTVETCSSGLTLYRGDVGEIAPEDLATQLCMLGPVYLIVDFNNLGSPPPEDLVSPDYLFSWLEDDAAALVSPIVLSQTDFLGWPDLLKQGWGLDAVVCLCSKLQKPDLLDHLRNVIRAKPDRGDMRGGIIGYCWPSVMGMLLGHNTPMFVQKLLAGIDAVLVEFPDLPETWQLYGDEQIRGALDQLGFVHKPVEEATAGAEDV